MEVKGSVELAPLTGLVDGIVDLTASGKTLAENNLRVMEQIAHLHGAADRQPGGAQAEGRADRLDPGADPRMRIVRNRDRPQRARVRRPSRRSREIIDEVRRGGDAAVLELTERFDHAELGPEQLRVDPHELEASVGVLEPDGARRACAPRSRT